MNGNVVECSRAERDAGAGGCACRAASLGVLRDVHCLYEDRMARIDRLGGTNKLQLQVKVLRSWVSDLVGQNTLLARAVEELEEEATSKLLAEKRRHEEVVCELRAECAALRRRVTRKDSDQRGLLEVLRRLREFDYCTLDGIHFFEVTESDIFGSVDWRSKKLEGGDRDSKKACTKVTELKMVNEALHKENSAKDREIRQLNKDAQHYEQTIMNLRSELSLNKYDTPDGSRKDAEVMAGMCCTGTECGDWVPVKDYTEVLQDDAAKYQERMLQMEANLKSSASNVRALRKANALLSTELHELRHVCGALGEQCRAAELHARFRDDIIREMRAQLRHAKAKDSTSYHVATSTPNASRDIELELNNHEFPDMSVICVDRSVSAPILVSDVSVADLGQTFNKICHCSKQNSSSNKGTPRGHRGILKHSPRNSTNSDQKNLKEKKRASALGINRSPRGESPCPSTSSLKRSPRNKAKCEQCSAANQTSDIEKHSPRKVTTKGSPHGQSCATEKDVYCHRDVEELYFNSVVKSVSFGNGGRCNSEECERSPEASTTETSSKLTKVEKEELNRSCERIFKESAGAGACSPADSAASASGSCDAARAQYYHNKLLSTLQILQNKEETIRVQAESLAVAEGRLAALGARAAELRGELDRKTNELNSLQSTMDCSRVLKADVSIMAEPQEANEQSVIVNTLENNLSVIEELYRECFYETAKQEGLIDMLRKSYLDVRGMDRHKAAHIGRLQTVITAQQCELDRCQDIAMEVDNLKTEISNFLNSSTNNNDSGVWETRSEAPPPAAIEDLHEIMDQLLRLRDVLASGCICGLQQENNKLKQINEDMKMRMNELRREMGDLESTLRVKDSMDATYRGEIESKEKELYTIRQQLLAFEEGSVDQTTTCEALTSQLKQAQVLLEDKSAECAELQRRCAAQEHTITHMKDELDKADHIIKENFQIRSEVSHLTDEVSQWRAQLADSARRAAALDAELRRARAHVAHVDACYREKASNAAELQAQLEEAHSRGAALCGEARHAVGAVRLWVRRMRDRHTEQETIIQEKEALITSLQERVGERLNNTRRSCASERGPSCSKCASSRQERERTVSIETNSCCPKVEKRREQLMSSGSEMASCSSAPVPPRRLLRKKSCAARGCACGAGASAASSAGSQAPERAHAHTSQLRFSLHRFPRDVSPTEELFLRVEHLSDALADGQRRWARPRDER